MSPKYPMNGQGLVVCGLNETMGRSITPKTTHELADAVGFDEPHLIARLDHVIEAYSQRTAIDSWGRGSLTYGQLNERADRLAHRLREVIPRATQAVAGPQDTPRVGLLLDQGIEFITAVVATLKAGCAFVPLDPSYPNAKLIPVLNDAQPEAVLTLGQGLGRLEQLGVDAAKGIAVDQLPEAEHEAVPPLAIEPHRLACLVYTSGSTGRPKGVMHTHAGVLQNAAVHIDAFNLTHEDRQSLVYPCAVYGGLRDVFNGLLSGAALHHYPVRDAGYDGLVPWLIEHRVTVFCCIVSIFRHLGQMLDAADGPANRFPDVRQMKLGGEPVLRTDFDLFCRHMPDHCRLSCGLGATETGMSLRFPVTQSTPWSGNAVPLGRPVFGVEVFVLDEQGQPVAERPGEAQVGELAIRSRHLSAGYLGRDDLNAQVFSGDADSPDRFFYTGDLIKRLPDGVFVHQGRKDHQVQVNGNRVELLEIQAALEAHPEVRDALVVTEHEPTGLVRLVAHLTLEPQDDGSSPLTVNRLRQHLGARLANFAVPKRYLVHAQLPQTPGGKRDRLALPKSDDPGVHRLPIGAHEMSSTAAANPADLKAEQAIAEVFAYVLADPDVDDAQGYDVPAATASFFDLGGDSLQAIEVLQGIEKTLGVRLEVATLLRCPSPRELANAIAEKRGASGSAERGDGLEDSLTTIAFRPFDRGAGSAHKPLFTVSGRGGSVICFRDLAQRLPEDWPVIGLQMPGVNEDETPLESMADIAQEMVRRMQEVQPFDTGPYHVLGYSFGGSVCYEIAQLLAAAGQRVAYLGIIDSHAPGTRTLKPRRQRLGKIAQQFLGKTWPQRIDWIRCKIAGVPDQAVVVPDYRVELPKENDFPQDMANRLNAVSEAARVISLTYRSKPQTHTPVTLFRCTQLHPWLEAYIDKPDRGWSEFAPMGKTYLLDCKHLDVFQARNKQMIAAAVAQSLRDLSEAESHL